jgi:hypothetical protein
MRMHRQPLYCRLMRQGLGLGLGIVATASIAHAHGGMAGPDELGPPLLTSAALAFVCYWVVILWPASKRKGSDNKPPGKRMATGSGRRHTMRTSMNSDTRQTSQLRRVGNHHAHSGSGSGRRASDV